MGRSARPGRGAQPDGGAPLILFGGTFDPIHRAHIRAALAVSRRLGGAEVRLLPNAVPPHRPQPHASASQRLAMVRLACVGHSRLHADGWELSRSGPSYTLATLRHYRQQIGAQRSLVLLIGADSFAGLADWHRWPEFAALCHLAVVSRPGAPTPPAKVRRAFPLAPASGLMRRPAGKRLMLKRPHLDVSSTDIRHHLLKHGRGPALTARVRTYIRRHRLYTVPDNHSRH